MEYEIGGACSRYGRQEMHIKSWSENLKGKLSLGRPRHRWKIRIRT
jgi:hypothetical protein